MNLCNFLHISPTIVIQLHPATIPSGFKAHNKVFINLINDPSGMEIKVFPGVHSHQNSNFIVWAFNIALKKPKPYAESELKLEWPKRSEKFDCSDNFKSLCQYGLPA